MGIYEYTDWMDIGLPNLLFINLQFLNMQFYVAMEICIVIH